jgi:hypothetical protein
MHTIAIRVRAMDLSAEMAAMRKWLDEHRSEPSNFTFRRFGNIISIYIVFDKDADGEAFKARFHGRPQGPEPDSITEDLAQVLTQNAR